MPANAPDNPEFHGKDLKECEQFISAVNKHARAEGKLRDDQWIADFVATCLTGEAVVWWSLLDEETQGSWRRLQKAMISNFPPLFYGKSSVEAEDFVYQIRRRALHMGKLDDSRWTAEFASGCFVGSALRWYMSLDSSVRSDWDSLQQAIFAQYNQDPVGGSLLSIIPTPALAAAPYAAKSRLRGRIRASMKGKPGIYYLSRILGTISNQPGRLLVTSAVSDALEVEYEPTAGTDGLHTLTIPDNLVPGCDVLGMKWYADDNDAPYNFLALCGVESNSRTGSPGERYVGPLLTRAWKITQMGNDQGVLSVTGVTGSGEHLFCLTGGSGDTLSVVFKRRKTFGEDDLELFFDYV